MRGFPEFYCIVFSSWTCSPISPTQKHVLCVVSMTPKMVCPSLRAKPTSLSAGAAVCCRRAAHPYITITTPYHASKLTSRSTCGSIALALQKWSCLKASSEPEDTRLGPLELCPASRPIPPRGNRVPPHHLSAPIHQKVALNMHRAGGWCTRAKVRGAPR